MTKKDYEKFAAMLKVAMPAHPFSYHGTLTPADEEQFRAIMQYHAAMVESCAAIFAKDNPNFNRQKFINTIIGR